MNEYRHGSCSFDLDQVMSKEKTHVYSPIDSTVSRPAPFKSKERSRATHRIRSQQYYLDPARNPIIQEQIVWAQRRKIRKSLAD
jgi:hypothetical protein